MVIVAKSHSQKEETCVFHSWMFCVTLSQQSGIILDGVENDYLQKEEEAEPEATTYDLVFDPYDDCLTNISQNVFDKLMVSDDEHDDDFEEL